MYDTQHPKADIDIIYLKRGDGGRDLIGVKDYLQAEVNDLKEYVNVR